MIRGGDPPLAWRGRRGCGRQQRRDACRGGGTGHAPMDRVIRFNPQASRGVTRRHPSAPRSRRRTGVGGRRHREGPSGPVRLPGVGSTPARGTVRLFRQEVRMTTHGPGGNASGTNVQHEAASSLHHLRPTAERYQNALHRYLDVVAGRASSLPDHPPVGAVDAARRGRSPSRPALPRTCADAPSPRPLSGMS